jgi:hypothetical protein
MKVVIKSHLFVLRCTSQPGPPATQKTWLAAPTADVVLAARPLSSCAVLAPPGGHEVSLQLSGCSKGRAGCSLDVSDWTEQDRWCQTAVTDQRDGNGGQRVIRASAVE